MSTENLDSLPQVITPEMKEAINSALQEMSNSFIRADAEKDLQKDIVNRMKEEFDIPKNYFKKLSKLHHARNLAEEMAQEEEFFNFAAAILDRGENTLEYKE